MKRNSLLRIAVILALLGGLARYGLVSMSSVSSEQTLAAPDMGHMVKVSNRWREDFWTGEPRECHSVTIENRDGRVIRHVETDEPWTGWPKDGSIEWAADSMSVVLTFKAQEAVRTRLTLDVRP